MINIAYPFLFNFHLPLNIELLLKRKKITSSHFMWTGWFDIKTVVGTDYDIPVKHRNVAKCNNDNEIRL